MQRDFYKAEAEEAGCQSLSDTVGSSPQISYISTYNNSCHIKVPSLCVHQPMLLYARHVKGLCKRDRIKIPTFWQTLELHNHAGEGADDWGGHAAHAV